MLLAEGVVSTSEVLAIGDVESDDSSSGEAEPSLSATHRQTRPRGVTGIPGVSRRTDTKTKRISYQASVTFGNLAFRSKYTSDIQVAIDFHIVLLQLRDAVEGEADINCKVQQAAFDEACVRACMGRREDLDAMAVSYYVDVRAFGTKFCTPSTASLENVLGQRNRLLQAREAGEQSFRCELIAIFQAGRSSVYKRSRTWSPLEAEAIVQVAFARAAARRRPAQAHKEELERRRAERSAAKASRAASRAARRAERWNMVAARAERYVARDERKARRAFARDAQRQLVERRKLERMERAACQAQRVAEGRRRLWRRRLISFANLRNLTLAEQQEMGARLRYSPE